MNVRQKGHLCSINACVSVAPSDQLHLKRERACSERTDTGKKTKSIGKIKINYKISKTTATDSELFSRINRENTKCTYTAAAAQFMLSLCLCIWHSSNPTAVARVFVWHFHSVSEQKTWTLDDKQCEVLITDQDNFRSWLLLQRTPSKIDDTLRFLCCFNPFNAVRFSRNFVQNYRAAEWVLILAQPHCHTRRRPTRKRFVSIEFCARILGIRRWGYGRHLPEIVGLGVPMDQRAEQPRDTRGGTPRAEQETWERARFGANAVAQLRHRSRPPAGDHQHLSLNQSGHINRSSIESGVQRARAAAMRCVPPGNAIRFSAGANSAIFVSIFAYNVENQAVRVSAID